MRSSRQKHERARKQSALYPRLGDELGRIFVQWEDIDDSEIEQKFNSINGEMQLIRQFMAMLSKSSVACCIEDRKGRVLYANSSARKLWKPKECIGKTVAELLDLMTGYEPSKQNRRIVKEGRPSVVFAPTVNKQGEAAVRTIWKVPLWDDNDDIVVGLIMF